MSKYIPGNIILESSHHEPLTIWQVAKVTQGEYAGQEIYIFVEGGFETTEQCNTWTCIDHDELWESRRNKCSITVVDGADGLTPEMLRKR